MDMVLPAADPSEFEKLLPRPYTSGAVSAFSAEAMFSTENSIYSTRPSTSACSLGAQTRASSRSLRPRPWCQTSRRRNEGSRSNHGGLSSRSLGGSQTPLQRDRRGYETFEQLLQPGWRTPAELQEILAPKQVNENSRRDSEDDDADARGRLPYGKNITFLDEKRGAVVLGVGKTIWGAQKQMEADAKEKPLYQQKRNALKQAQTHSPFAMRGELEPPPDESSSATSSDDEEGSSSSDSVDPMLESDIGDLLPQKTAGWANTFTGAKEKSMSRRGGLDQEMIAMAEFAVAAQQAAMREAQEAQLPVEVLPGVYFGHLESPRSTLLPRTPKVGRLQKLEHSKLQQDNVHQRKLLSLPHQDRDYEYFRMDFMPKMEEPKTSATGTGRRKMASTWDAGKEPQQKGPLSAEEEERIKEEKAQYDDWRRQVLLCARHLNTHINRFETFLSVAVDCTFQPLGTCYSSDHHPPVTATTLASTSNSHRFCPFAQRAWIALEEKGVAYQYVAIEPYQEDASKPGGYSKNPLPLDGKKRRYPDFMASSPKGLLPAIEYAQADGSVHRVHESMVCVEYVDEALPGPSLMPSLSRPEARARVRIWCAYVGEKIIPHFYRLLMRETGDERQAEKKNLLDGLLVFAQAMDPVADGRGFFLGEEFTMVDVALCPWWTRFRSIAGTYRGFEVPRGGDWDRLHAWGNSCEKRPSVARTILDQNRLIANYTGYADASATSTVAQTLAAKAK
ncbi:PARC [Symbiodinium pilosum]|uniref:PARC protein n=1 Tax=Symbiodinium pilosum TaxID=2952 RepID=A0A812XER9_SYMPI|nr:PARC [Symbiodinium pilosum]